MPKEPLILYVSAETLADLDRMAEEQDRSRSAVARRILEEHLKVSKGRARRARRG